jgi:hypothetical protein
VYAPCIRSDVHFGCQYGFPLYSPSPSSQKEFEYDYYLNYKSMPELRNLPILNTQHKSYI